MPRPLRRRSVRDPDDNYMSGAYLVTICTHQRRHTLGVIDGIRLRPTRLGSIAYEEWEATVERYRRVLSECFVVMPNHVHAVVELTGSANEERHGPGGLAPFVGSFKRAVARSYQSSEPVWQRSYHDRVLRSGEAIDDAIAYVLDNPMNWKSDPLAQGFSTGRGSPRNL